MREKLVDSRNLKPVKIWNPGSVEAQKFCMDLNLPMIFAGTKSLTKKLALEKVSYIPPLGDLEDYQLEVLNRAKNLIREEKNSLISIPTGSGKTRVATELVMSLHKEQNLKNIVWPKTSL